MAQQDAMVQEALDQSFLWRTWASWKNAMPVQPIRNVVGSKPAKVEKPVLAPAQSQPAPVVETLIESRPSLLGFAGKSLLGAALIGGSGVAGGALYEALAPKDESPAVTQSAKTEKTAEPNDGDLLKYLRQHGYHVSPEVKQ